MTGLEIHTEHDKSGKQIHFVIDTSMSFKRPQQMWEKEPLTIEWIRAMPKDAKFLDVGANIGIYTLFAAIVPEVDVIALEPMCLNFSRLMQNIDANGLTNVTAYPFAADAVTRISELNIGRLETGRSGHQLEGYPMTDPLMAQGCFSVRLGDLGIMPTHIKIDTDGNELRILQGARELLHHVTSVLVEVDIRQHGTPEQILMIMTEAGFRHAASDHLRTDGFENWIFER